MNPLPECLRSNTPPPQPDRIKPLTATLEVVTPMFLAGAEQHVIDHELLRVPSLRGMLRWWWRAAQADTDNQTLADKEARIWGGLPSKDKPYPPRGIRISAAIPKEIQQTKISGSTGSAEFYLSYALGGDKKSSPRPGFAPEQTVEITFHCQNEKQRVAAKQALRLLTTFGGLGSRNRRSWGSLRLDCVDGDSMPKPRSHEDVHREQRELLQALPSRQIDGSKLLRSILGRNVRCEVARCSMNHQELLGTVHAIFKGPDKLHKEAWCFGLPHTKGKNAIQDGPRWVERRASPIVIKATRLEGADRFALSALLLDGAFLDFSKHGADQDAYEKQCNKLSIFLDQIRDCSEPRHIAPPSRARR